MVGIHPSLHAQVHHPGYTTVRPHGAGVVYTARLRCPRPADEALGSRGEYPLGGGRCEG